MSVKAIPAQFRIHCDVCQKTSKQLFMREIDANAFINKIGSGWHAGGGVLCDDCYAKLQPSAPATATRTP